ncbi:hypothetical protein Tco_0994685 [Tanacetum coccineum]
MDEGRAWLALRLKVYNGEDFSYIKYMVVVVRRVKGFDHAQIAQIQILDLLGVKAEHQKPLGLLQQPEIPEWKSPICWSEDEDSQLTGLKIIRETTEKIVSPWKSVIRFGKRGTLIPRYVGPFKIIDRVGPMAYKLELPNELRGIHNTFHVSNLKKCLADENLIIPLEEIQLDDK